MAGKKASESERGKDDQRELCKALLMAVKKAALLGIRKVELLASLMAERSDSYLAEMKALEREIERVDQRERRMVVKMVAEKACLQVGLTVAQLAL